MKNSEELLKKIKQLETELKKVKSCKRYGLVWEDKPEIFEEKAKNALPILKEDQTLRIEEDENKPNNIIIEGDNFHSLSTLSYSHKGKIDVIYIDPPYNTGKKDFIYNDTFVDTEDSYRHSKWLSFMYRRLKIAKDLLSDNGFIFISIDENEGFNLKLLCDEIFLEKNYVGTLSVENNPKGRKNSKFISISSEFCIIYCKNKNAGETFFLENIPKDKNDFKTDEFGNLYTSGKRVLVGKSSNDKIQDYGSSKHYSVYYNESKNLLKIEKELDTIKINERLINNGYKRYISTNGKYFIHNTYSEHEFIKLFNNQSLEFKQDSIYEKDFNQYVRTKSLLVNKKEKDLDFKTETAGKQIQNLGLSFSNPKNYKYIQFLLKLIPNKNSTILDFFAGSGTTGHAVMELNKEDGGNRQFILCSSKENSKEDPEKNICKNITYERNKRIIEGYTNLKGEKIEGLGGNLRYYTTEFIKADKSIDDLRYSFIDMCDDLLCIKENTFNEVNLKNSVPELRLFKKGDKYTTILYDIHHFKDLVKLLEVLEGKVSVYIFSLSKDIFEEELEHFKNVTVQNIPDDILQTYNKIFNF